MKKIFTSVVLLAAGLFAANAQQLKTGDSFTYTTADGVEKTYTVTGENLIENPSFDNNTEGWLGGGGGTMTGVDWQGSGGVDDGAYLRLTENAGKGGNGSIGTAWEIEKGKTYVFSYFIRQNTNTEAVAKEGYIVTSETDTPRGDETKTIMYAHEDANCAWTQNLVVTTAEYKYLQFCARWLGGSKCFDAFILAEVEEAANPLELEQLLESCAEWLDIFGDEANEIDAFQPIVDEAQALVDGEEYTADDLNAMVHTLNEALLDFRMANASDEYTVDVTARYITNPNFDNGLSGWERVNEDVNNGINVRFLEYFGESSRVCEIQNAPSADSRVQQTVYNLPLGYYRFTVQAVMNHSVDKEADPEAKSGAAIYCNGAELDMVTAQNTSNNATKDNSYPETFTIQGIVSADSIVVGFVGYKECNFTYVGFDNVKLEYAGFDAGIYIDALISDIYTWMDENSDKLLPNIGYFLEEEISEAENAYGEEDDVMTAAYKRLDAAFATAKESIVLMEKLEEKASSLEEEIGTTGYPGAEAALAVIAEVGEFLSLNNEEATYDDIVAMIAKIEKALADYRMSQESTKDHPGNYSFFIQNPNFEVKDGWTWNLTHDGGGSDIWVGGCRPATADGENRQGLNIWGNHIVSIDVQQTLTGLPNGLYAISAEMITQTDYATDQHLYVASSINTSTSPALEVEGWDNYEWTTLTTGYAIVNDGQLTIGAGSNTGGTASQGWFQLTNVQLYYYGAADESDLAAAWDATLERANGIAAQLLPGDATMLNAKIEEAKALESKEAACALLKEPINTAVAAAGAYASFKGGAYKTAVDNKEVFGTDAALEVLGAAIAFVDAITAADTTTSAAIGLITEKLNAYNSYITYLDEVGYMIVDRGAGYAQSNINDVKVTIDAQKADLLAEFQSKSNVDDLKAKLEDVVSYLIKSAFANAKAGDDATALIVNPTFDSNANGWIVNKGNGNTETNKSQHWGGDAENRYMDSYNGTKKALNFRASQILSDIPNGTYTVTVATRADSIGAYVFALGEAITDTLVNDSTIMLQVANSANTKWHEIQFHADSLGGIWETENSKWEAGNEYNTDIHNANNGKGYGWTWVTIDDIVVTNHEMVIGVTTDSTVTKKAGFEGKWFSVDDWSLTIKAVGDNSDWVIESGIENVAATVQKTVYYAIDGRQLAIPSKGINIVKTVYSDGRIEVKKVYVK